MKVIKFVIVNKTEDVNRIRKVISSNEGVVACQINKEKGEVSVVFDSYFCNIEQIIQSIEDLGYTWYCKKYFKSIIIVVKYSLTQSVKEGYRSL